MKGKLGEAISIFLARNPDLGLRTRECAVAVWI